MPGPDLTDFAIFPAHPSPALQNLRFGYRVGYFPFTENQGRHGLVLLFSGMMSEEQVEFFSAGLSIQNWEY